MMIEFDNHPLENTKVLCPDGQLGVAKWFSGMGQHTFVSVVTEGNELRKLFLSSDGFRNKDILFENQ